MGRQAPQILVLVLFISACSNEQGFKGQANKGEAKAQPAGTKPHFESDSIQPISPPPTISSPSLTALKCEISPSATEIKLGEDIQLNVVVQGSPEKVIVEGVELGKNPSGLYTASQSPKIDTTYQAVVMGKNTESAKCYTKVTVLQLKELAVTKSFSIDALHLTAEMEEFWQKNYSLSVPYGSIKGPTQVFEGIELKQYTTVAASGFSGKTNFRAVSGMVFDCPEGVFLHFKNVQGTLLIPGFELKTITSGTNIPADAVTAWVGVRDNPRDYADNGADACLFSLTLGGERYE